MIVYFFISFSFLFDYSHKYKILFRHNQIFNIWIARNEMLKILPVQKKVLYLHLLKGKEKSRAELVSTTQVFYT
jgi:hypothetical protein